MGTVIFWAERHHARASTGSSTVKPAKASKVMLSWPRSPAIRTKALHRAAGIPRSRQQLTVESERESAPATTPVPPSASMIDPGVNMERNIVCKMQTSQGLSSGETTLRTTGAQIVGMTDNKRIGRRVEAIRKALGFESQEEFAIEIGLNKSTYSQIKTGERRLSLDTALVMRTQYRIPLDYLYFGDALGQLPIDIAEVLKRAA